MSGINNDKLKAIDSGPKWHWSYLILMTALLFLVYWIYYWLSIKLFAVSDTANVMVAGMLVLTVFLMCLGLVKRNISYVWWEALLLAFGFCGIWILALTVWPGVYGILAAAVLTLVTFFWPLVLWHNIVFLLGTLGLGLFISMRFPFEVLLICALGVVAYEMQRQNKFEMAALYADAWSVGLPPGFLIPAELKNWLADNQKTWQAGKGMVVGFLPLIIISAIAFRLLHKDLVHFIVLVLVLLGVGFVWGRDKKYHLRTWLFTAAAAILYALSGLLKYIL